MAGTDLIVQCVTMSEIGRDQLSGVRAAVEAGTGFTGGALARHVLDAMTALLRSAAEGRRIELTTTAERPPAVPLTPADDWRNFR
jgi:hypothetical protein